MASTSAKTRCNGTMTEAQYLSWIRSALRSKSLRWPPRAECLKLARRAYKGPNKMQKWEFLCAMCKEWQLGKNCQVDHFPIDAGSIPNIEAVGAFANNLFCEVGNLRCLCKTCHSQYTLSQRKGISLEQAKMEKQATEICKMSVAKQIEWLFSKNVIGDRVSNQAKRRDEIMNILKGELI